MKKEKKCEKNWGIENLDWKSLDSLRFSFKLVKLKVKLQWSMSASCSPKISSPYFQVYCGSNQKRWQITWRTKNLKSSLRFNQNFGSRHIPSYVKKKDLVGSKFLWESLNYGSCWILVLAGTIKHMSWWNWATIITFGQEDFATLMKFLETNTN